MQNRRATLTVALLFLVAPRAWGQWAVIDGSNLLQNTMTAFNSVKTAVNTAQQVVNEYTMIRNQIDQIANQVKNLQHFDLDDTQRLLSLGNAITGTLRQAQGVSFELAQATRQFDTLYPRLQQQMSAAQILTMRLEWLTQRRQAASVGIQVQSITQDLQNMYTQVGTLLTSAATAQGNLDINQIQAQQQGITQGILLQTQQLMAGSARAATQQQAEEAVLEAAALHAQQQAMTPIPDYQGGRGKMWHFSW